MKLFMGSCPNFPRRKIVGRIGTGHGEEWDMYGKIKISN